MAETCRSMIDEVRPQPGHRRLPWFLFRSTETNRKQKYPQNRFVETVVSTNKDHKGCVFYRTRLHGIYIDYNTATSFPGLLLYIKKARSLGNEVDNTV